jgi:hypothetical protein
LDAVCSGTPETVDPDTPSLVPSEGNTEEGPRREVGNSLWPADADPARLEFVSSWPIPRSTDILQTFSWGTLDALKLILTKPNSQETAKNTPPAYSDHKYDYYQVYWNEQGAFAYSEIPLLRPYGNLDNGKRKEADGKRREDSGKRRGLKEKRRYGNGRRVLPLSLSQRHALL